MVNAVLSMPIVIAIKCFQRIEPYLFNLKCHELVDQVSIQYYQNYYIPMNYYFYLTREEFFGDNLEMFSNRTLLIINIFQINYEIKYY